MTNKKAAGDGNPQAATSNIKHPQSATDSWEPPTNWREVLGAHPVTARLAGSNASGSPRRLRRALAKIERCAARKAAKKGGKP